MKAVLVIDLPDRCFACPFHSTVDGEHEHEFKVFCNIRFWKEYNRPVENLEERPSWCPLKHLPRKKNTDFHPNIVYANGWNACLDEITGENNE